MSDTLEFLRPDWPAPDRVRAVVTTRTGGVSADPYASFNLGDHVGDDPACVERNRAVLRRALALPAEPFWLTQVHGTRVIDIADSSSDKTADGAYANQRGLVCAILTADCLSIFLCDRRGSEVALLHGGWRGLVGGIIEAGLEKFRAPRETLIAWLGPAISAQAYEVGDDVRDAFLARDPRAAGAFGARGQGKWHLDLYVIARARLLAGGVQSVRGGGYCTASQSDSFFSYRRDGVTGRMASLLWLV